VYAFCSIWINWQKYGFISTSPKSESGFTHPSESQRAEPSRSWPKGNAPERYWASRPRLLEQPPRRSGTHCSPLFRPPGSAQKKSAPWPQHNMPTFFYQVPYDFF